MTWLRASIVIPTEWGKLLATVRRRYLDQFQNLSPAFGLLILEL